MYTYRCKILRVVDGDTVDIDIDLGFGVWLHRERVRIVGIDAPESRTRDRVEKLFGLAAKTRIREILPVGSTVTLMCKEYDSTGKFGRIIADFEVYSHRTDSWGSLANQLIEEGHCVAYFGGSKEEIAMKHLANREKLLREGVVSKEDYDAVVALMEEK